MRLCGLVAASVAALLGARPCWSLEYRDARNGWGIRLPDGWVEVAPSDVAALESGIRQATGMPVDYSTAFRPPGEAETPLVVVSSKPLKRVSLERVASSVRSDRVRQKLRTVQADLVVGAPTLDTRRNLVIFKSTNVRSEDGVPVEGMSAFFPGRHCVAIIALNSRPETFARDLQDFEAVLDSFRFDPGLGYDPQAPGPSERDQWLFWLFGVVVVSWILRRRSRRRRSSDDIQPRND